MQKNVLSHLKKRLNKRLIKALAFYSKKSLFASSAVAVVVVVVVVVLHGVSGGFQKPSKIK